MEKVYKLPEADMSCPLFLDILQQPHTLIAGTTGSGKSVVLNGILKAVFTSCLPDDCFLVLIDPKKVELQFNGVPHVKRHATTPRAIAEAVDWTCRVMDSRYSIMAGYRAKKWTGAHMFVIIDEYADISCDKKVIKNPGQAATCSGKTQKNHTCQHAFFRAFLSYHGQRKKARHQKRRKKKCFLNHADVLRTLKRYTGIWRKSCTRIAIRDVILRRTSGACRLSILKLLIA